MACKYKLFISAVRNDEDWKNQTCLNLNAKSFMEPKIVKVITSLSFLSNTLKSVGSIANVDHKLTSCSMKAKCMQCLRKPDSRAHHIFFTF